MAEMFLVFSNQVPGDKWALPSVTSVSRPFLSGPQFLHL